VWDFIYLKKMVTPIFMQYIYWIGLAACVIIGFVRIIQGAGVPYGGGTLVFSGILTLFLGPIVVRIACELIVVLFQISDTLKDIRDGNRGDSRNIADPL